MCSMGTQLPQKKGTPIPGDVVLDGVAAPPKRGTASQFSVHVYCGQTAGWMKTPLGTEVDLGPGHIVLDGVPANRQRGTAAPPSFWPMSIVDTVDHLSYCCGLVTFRVSRTRREMYSGLGRLCVSVRGCIPVLLHGPGCKLGCPWLCTIERISNRCMAFVAVTTYANAQCQRVLVLALCLVCHGLYGSTRCCISQWPSQWEGQISTPTKFSIYLYTVCKHSWKFNGKIIFYYMFSITRPKHKFL